MRHRPPAARAAGGSMVVRLCRSLGRKGLPLGGGERLHRQRVDLSAHSIAERRIDALVALDPTAAFEIGGDDGGKEVPAVAFNLEMRAFEAGSDEVSHFRGGGVGHEH
jgi:hypothetical protein